MAKIYKNGDQLIVKDADLPIIAQMELDTGLVIPVDLKILDGRAYSEKQRKFIFALCSAYAYETGKSSEVFRASVMQIAYDVGLVRNLTLRAYTMSEANALITLMISTLIDQDIPISGKLLRDNEYHFSQQQTYMLCLKRTCIICGRRAHIHHVDQIGMRSRKKISHVGMRALPLCYEHHDNAHTKGNDYMIDTYHLTPCIIDEKLEYFIKKGIIKTFEEDASE